MNKEIDKGFLDQLPETGHISIEELYPRLDELKKYGEWFFDPRYDGYERDLEYICDLPGRKILTRGNHDMFWDAKRPGSSMTSTSPG